MHGKKDYKSKIKRIRSSILDLRENDLVIPKGPNELVFHDYSSYGYSQTYINQIIDNSVSMFSDKNFPPNLTSLLDRKN